MLYICIFGYNKDYMYVLYVLFMMTVQFLCSTSAVVMTVNFIYFTSVVVVKVQFLCCTWYSGSGLSPYLLCGRGSAMCVHQEAGHCT